jgi:phage terminase large subunit GpA-like protein
MSRPTSSEYSAYLRSPHWLRLRARYKRERPWRCVCGARKGLQLHHKTYDRLGDERLEDLTPLCQRCHTLLHQLAAEGQATLDPATLFLQGRAAIYAKTRTDHYKKAPREQLPLGHEKLKGKAARNARKARHAGGDWRSERVLPRKGRHPKY